MSESLILSHETEMFIQGRCSENSLRPFVRVLGYVNKMNYGVRGVLKSQQVVVILLRDLYLAMGEFQHGRDFCLYYYEKFCCY